MERGGHRLPGIEPGDWFSITCDFAPPEIAEAEGRALGARTMAAQDACLRDEGFLLWQVLDHEPDALVFGEMLPFLDHVVGVAGKPGRGWVISHSCWQSSVELAVDDVNWIHGEMLEAAGIAFGPMRAEDRNALCEWAHRRGEAVLFDADDLAGL